MNNSTWGNTEVKWFFDCDNDDSSNRLEQIKQNLTDFEQLQNDLFTQYDPIFAPKNLDGVRFSFDMTIASFNSKKSFMTSRGKFFAVNSNKSITI